MSDFNEIFDMILVNEIKGFMNHANKPSYRNLSRDEVSDTLMKELELKRTRMDNKGLPASKKASETPLTISHPMVANKILMSIGGGDGNGGYKKAGDDIVLDLDKYVEIISKKPVDGSGVKFVKRSKWNGRRSNSRKIIEAPTSTKIFTANEKIQKSRGEGFMTIAFGIPAISTILWDEENETFVKVDTCPGAGSCMVSCYARKNRIIMHDTLLPAIQRLQWMMNDPEGFEEATYKELEDYARTANAHNLQLRIRWNDSGDFFSDDYFDMTMRLTERLRDNNYDVISYAYTAVAKYLKQSNDYYILSFSFGAKPQEQKKVDVEKQKSAFIVPKSVYRKFGLTVGDPDPEGKRPDKDMTVKQATDEDAAGKGWYSKQQHRFYSYDNEEMKDAIYDWAKKKGYKPVRKNIIYFDFLPWDEINNAKFEVIVTTSDPDEAAQRKDVRFSYLLEH